MMLKLDIVLLKIVFMSVFSCSKLKQYITPVVVYVYSYFDVIKLMLLKLILHSRVGKWAFPLSE